MRKRYLYFMLPRAIAPLLLSLATATALSAPASVARASIVDTNAWITDGRVDCAAISGSTLYIGGIFNHMAPARGTWVPVDTTAGAALSNFPPILGAVETSAPDGAGGFYIGGNFTAVGGLPRTGLAHILADGSVSPWAPVISELSGFPWMVTALAVSGNTVYVGGNFLYGTVGGQPRDQLAALDATTGLARPGWAPEPNGAVHSLLVSGSKLYVGGDFTTIGGVARERLAALDAATGVPTSWKADLAPTNASGDSSKVLSLLLQSGVLYVGGDFHHIGGVAHSCLAAVDPSTAAVSSWNPAPDAAVYGLAAGGGRIFACGSFKTMGVNSRPSLASIDPLTGSTTGFDLTLPYGAGAVAWSNGTLYAATSVSDYATSTIRQGCAAWNAATGHIKAWNPSVWGGDLYVHTIGTDGARVWLGGGFTTVGGLARSYIAAIDLNTGIPTSWSILLSGMVTAIATNGTTVYFGGSFVHYAGGKDRSFLAAADATTGAVTNWDPGMDVSDSLLEIDALAVGSTGVYVGGVFSTVKGQARANLAEVDLTTGAPLAFHADTDGPVKALALSGSTLYVGGSFGTLSSASRANAGAVSATSGATLGWDPEPDGEVDALLPTGNRVFLGGGFYDLGSDPHPYLGVVDNLAGTAGPWDPSLTSHYGGSQIQALALGGPTLYVGGAYEAVGAVPRVALAAIDTTTGLATGWDPGFSFGEFILGSDVMTLAVSGTSVWAGGSFYGAAGRPQSYLVKLSRQLAGAAVGDRAISTCSLALPAPNPARAGTQMAFDLPAATRVDAEVLDLAGRVVRPLAEARDYAAGRWLLSWDGRDSHGRRAAAGVYFIRVHAGGASQTRRVVMLD